MRKRNGRILDVNFLFSIADIRPVLVQVQERHSTSPICFNLSTSLYSSPIEIVGDVISLKLSADNPAMSSDDRMKIIREYRTRYWLQAFGCEERLFGYRPLIQSRVRSTRFLRRIHHCSISSMYKHVFVWISNCILN